MNDYLNKTSTWCQQNLFNTWFNTLLTFVGLFLIYNSFVPLISWAIIHADWLGSDRSACNSGGACWVFIANRLQQFIYGFYPSDAYWRIHLTAVIGLVSLFAYKSSKVHRGWNSFFLIFIYPFIALLLLHGGMFGLKTIETARWGGLFLTLVLAITGIVAAFPLGVILALGRQSNLFIIKNLCIGFIELIRGVPLISILFMASVMFPLFVPEELTIDKLARAMIGIILFQGAYLAEVVRGGLNAIPKGQSEAAKSLGMPYWQEMSLIVLPQALKIVIPGIVNTQIALFKDTTLVLIIGLFDFLGIVQAATTDPKWLGYTLEGYVFCAFIYWLFCFSLSQYSQRLEKRLSTSRDAL